MNNYSCPKCGNKEIAIIKTCIDKIPNGDSVCLRCRYRDRSEKFYEVSGEFVGQGIIEVERVIICLNCKKDVRLY